MCFHKYAFKPSTESACVRIRSNRSITILGLRILDDQATTSSSSRSTFTSVRSVGPFSVMEHYWICYKGPGNGLFCMLQQSQAIIKCSKINGDASKYLTK